MACEVAGDGADVQRQGRVDYVGAGLSAATTALKVLASGQAEAKATLMRLAVSMTRAATLMSRRRKVVNSAQASVPRFGNGLLDAPH